MTRQHEHHKRLREAGWARKEIWLSPEDQKRLDDLGELYGSRSKAVREALKQQHYADLLDVAKSQATTGQK